MNTNESYMPRSVFGFGIVTGIALIAYFMLVRTLGYIEIVELRYLNIVLLACGMLSAMNYRAHKMEGFSYLEGVWQGFGTAVVACTIFCFFIYTYLTIDKNFMWYLQQHAMFGNYLTPHIASGVVAMEGLASGAIITFVAMQHFKHFTFGRG